MVDTNQILGDMDLAAKQDRQRFFAIADAVHLQPKYAEHLEELEQIKQQWRDMTLLEGWPDVDWPLALPDWFPAMRFFARWRIGQMTDSE